MRSLNRKLISYFLVLMLAMSNMTYASSAYAREPSLNQEPSAGAMLMDGVFARIPMTVVTIFGAVLFVVTLPFSATGGNVGQAADKLVVEPFESAWRRPLGEM
jgi:hypothetical protein